MKRIRAAAAFGLVTINVLCIPDAGLHSTSMTMRSGSSLRDGTTRGPYTAASTTERSADGRREGEMKVGSGQCPYSAHAMLSVSVP